MMGIGEGIMQKALPFTSVFLSSAVAFNLSTAALAGSVTDADLRGKTICWSRGASITSGTDGFFYSTKIGKGTWRLDGDRLIGVGVRGEYVWTISKERGAFHLRGVTEANAESWGKYSK
jgi:hypothetical protein